jgi:hypothetical protein
MADQVLLFQDFKKIRKGLKALDSGLDRELKAGLKAVAAKVVTKAQSEATRKGLVDTGELVRRIAPSVTQKGVDIVAKAKRAGFSYPAVYEYGGRGKVNATGPRAFLRPGLQKAGPQIAKELENVIKSTVSKAGFK